MAGMDDLVGVTYESVVESGEEATKEVQAYIERLDFKALDPGSVGHAFFNGRYLEVGEDVRPSLFSAIHVVVDNANRSKSS
jgi:hypothetical protein